MVVRPVGRNTDARYICLYSLGMDGVFCSLADVGRQCEHVVRVPLCACVGVSVSVGVFESGRVSLASGGEWIDCRLRCACRDCWTATLNCRS